MRRAVRCGSAVRLKARHDRGSGYPPLIVTGYVEREVSSSTFLSMLKGPNMPDISTSRVEMIAKFISGILGIVGGLTAILFFISGYLNVQRIYNHLGFVHISQIPQDQHDAIVQLTSPEAYFKKCRLETRNSLSDKGKAFAKCNDDEIAISGGALCTKEGGSDIGDYGYLDH